MKPEINNTRACNGENANTRIEPKFELGMKRCAVGSIIAEDHQVYKLIQ